MKFVFTGSKDWRRWLSKNHARVSEVWVVLPKKSAGGDSYRVFYGEALDEAICYGWIDSRIKALDATRSLVRFSPRKSDQWSTSNLERARDLIRKKKMTQAGVKLLPEDMASGQSHV